MTPVHGVDAATRLAVTLYIGYNIAATVAAIPAGRLADRLGARGPVLVLAAGVALFGLAYAGFAPAAGVALFGLAYAGFAPGTGSPVLLAVPFVLAGIGIGAVETAEHAAVAALAPADARGSAFGVLATVQAVGNVAASAVAGILWSVFSPTVAFAYLVVWMLVALTGLLAATR